VPTGILQPLSPDPTDRIVVPRLLAAALTLLLLPLLAAAPAVAQEEPEDAPALAGEVTDAAGRPLDGATVTIVAADDPTTPVEGTRTGADGRWQLDVADGGYLVHARADGRADAWWEDAAEPGDAADVHVEDGVGPQDLLLALPDGGLVRGTVRGPEGPVAGVTVTVERTAFWSPTATTDRDGRFRLPGIRAGSRLVEVQPGDRPVASAERTIEVADGAEVVLDLTLPSRPVGVERVAGADRVATAVEASRRGFASAPAVVLAAAASFPDALAAAPLAARLEGPLLLVGPRLTRPVLDELRRLDAQEAVIVGAVGVVPLVVQEEVRRLGLDVRRIAGENRFDTAALIAREVGSADGRVIVASGQSFADALSVAPYAAAEQVPILLTTSDTLHADAADGLRDLGATETLIVGGGAVVGDAVARAVPAPTRVSGPTRYETSLAVAAHWAERGMRLETVSVATGRDFPDALAAGPVAALGRGPLLLVDGLDARNPEETYTWLAEHREEIGGIWAFGGDAVMVDGVLDRLRRTIGAGS
jgi:hypothetical protein